MRTPDIHYRKLVLVCTNRREDERGCCASKGGEDLRTKLKLAVAEKDPRIRVSKAGCLGNCLSGTTVVIMPDNIWLGEVTEEHIPELLELILK